MENFSEVIDNAKKWSVWNAYLANIARGDFVLVRSFTCGSLLIKRYRFYGTNWRSIGVFYGEDLIAIITENYKVYEFVNLFRFSDTTIAAIKADLFQYLNDLFSVIPPHLD